MIHCQSMIYVVEIVPTRKPMTTQTIPRRDQIPIEHTWNAESVFASVDDWEAEFSRVEAQIPTLARFRGRLGDGPATLAEWLAAVDELSTALGKLQTYAVMGHAVDAADQQATARYDRLAGLSARAQAATAFAEPELLALGGETLRSWVQADPRLAVYEHYFDQLARRAAHVRSAEVEELLGMVSEPFAAAAGTHSVLANADLRYVPARGATGEVLEVRQGTVNARLSHADREVRRSAWESYADAHLAVRHAMASCLAAGVKQQVFAARARHYPSALEASLSAGHIPIAVFDNLVETFRSNLPTWHRYWRIRRQALGYDKLHVYDIKAPLAARPPHVPFKRAVDWIAAGMRPLGTEYVELMRQGVLHQRWVDIYPKQGKRLGAFSSGAQGTHPFILMSYTDDIFSLSTLAHELGHSMHSYYTWHNQPPIYADYSLFVAEVASNFNQAMVRAHLLELDSDPDFQIAVA